MSWLGLARSQCLIVLSLELGQQLLARALVDQKGLIIPVAIVEITRCCIGIPNLGRMLVASSC
jgi:hypothetical protein